jgi:aspartyl-tRNA(Asn)/glutamyl-tRNA(Gln) amidotransferase subunit A
MIASPPFSSLAAAARAIKSKAISPVELVQTCLDRVARHDSALHVFITVTAERALADARAAEKEIWAGGWRGPLHGIPIGLKDVIETKGIPTTAHSRALQHNRPQHDAAVVERLREAGAVLMGKLATHEFALGGPSWDLPWPPARNPWNSAHFTGGSSSGPAAAVAAGMVLGAIGSDASGSVRSPAAFCGITGFKPGYDTIDARGVLPVAPSLDTVGVMAWTVEDCGLLFAAVGRADRAATPSTVSAPGIDIKGMRIKVLRHFYAEDAPINTENQAAIERALAVFRELGCTISQGRLPALPEWMACGFIILLSEVYRLHRRRLETSPGQYGAAFRNIVSLGAALSEDHYAVAERKRIELVAAMQTLMEDCDLLVTAVQNGAAPRLDKASPWAVFMRPSQAMPFSVTGQPALSLCCGYAENGLPLGFQVVGRRCGEAALLRAGQAYEQATGWHRRRPPCW